MSGSQGLNVLSFEGGVTRSPGIKPRASTSTWVIPSTTTISTVKSRSSTAWIKAATPSTWIVSSSIAWVQWLVASWDQRLVTSWVEALVASRGERLVGGWLVERLERLLSIVPSTTRGPVIAYVLIPDSDQVPGIVTVATVSPVVTSGPWSSVTVRTSRVESLVPPSCTRVESLVPSTKTRIISLVSSPSTGIEPRAEVSIDDWILWEVVGAGPGGTAGETSLVPEGIALIAGVGGGAPGLADLTGHHPALLVRDVLALRLWDVHTELDLFLLPAHHSVQQELPHLGLLGAGEVRPGEGMAVLLSDVTELTAS